MQSNLQLKCHKHTSQASASHRVQLPPGCRVGGIVSFVKCSRFLPSDHVDELCLHPDEVKGRLPCCSPSELGWKPRSLPAVQNEGFQRVHSGGLLMLHYHARRLQPKQFHEELSATCCKHSILSTSFVYKSGFYSFMTQGAHISVSPGLIGYKRRITDLPLHEITRNEPNRCIIGI